jgi:acyl-CoA synthetase (AMP-forming)/AMP-acid ligase II
MPSPLPATLPHLVLDAARAFGDAPAIVAESGERWSFRDLEREVRRAARAFLAAGLAHGERVAICAPNGPEWIFATLGLQMAGGVLVPVNTRFKGQEIAQLLNDSGARMLIAAGSFLGTDYLELLERLPLPALERRISLPEGRGIGWQDFLAEGDRLPAAAVDERLAEVTPDHICDMLFTSGTTGRPKGVLTTHGQNIRQYDVYGRSIGIRPGDHSLVINPFFHSFGYKAGWLAAFLQGATVYPHAVFDAETVLARIAAERITVMPGPPALFQGLLAAGYRDHDISSLRLSTTGSASVPVELVRQMHATLGIDQVLTAYGLSESCGVVTISSPDDDFETIATSVGRPIEGIEVKIVDAGGATLPPGAAGELLVRGYCVMKGYHEAPDATAEAIDAEGWLRTGDIAIAEPSGHLRITGRKKDVFIVGGFNCYPAEIENILLSHPDVQDVAVIGVPDQRLGEVAKAFIVRRAGSSATEEALIAWSRANMANYKVPRRIAFVADLPKNASGKVEKFKLRG